MPALVAHHVGNEKKGADLPLFYYQLSLIIILASLLIAITVRRDELAAKSVLWCTLVLLPQAVFVFAISSRPKSLMASSRNTSFCTLPLAVMG